ncbi:hypothetical protein [Longimicrobium terrae]|uniref:DUF4296 domain-containing protein n=1 Tax=Longimicrobium terrae TaxID=1639882 RepID=A0A841GVU7_9BACT|nr:hypothetical protein [Longimicrobium terrae]MBB4635179.1 hypothetical protein [Longimicrobium terrae]MBB6069573.1 hypothetical protein [Longimicrobium terrae]NNC31624.1 hypothetical protein [Longimicrobium terrae]
MTSRPLYAVVLLLSLAACGGEKKSDVLPRDRFVAASVALRLLPANATEAQRRETLKKFKVTNKQMLAWVDAHRRDPGALAEAWQDVAKRVDSLSSLRPVPPTPDSARGDSARADSAGKQPRKVDAPLIVTPPQAGRPGRVSPFDSLAKYRGRRRPPISGKPPRPTAEIQ